MNWLEKENLPRTLKLTRNRKTYQKQINWLGNWENLLITNEFTEILQTLTKNKWIYRNIGKTYQERMNWPEYLDYAWPPSPSCPCYPDAVYIIQELIIKVIHHLRIDINFWQLMIDEQWKLNIIS